MLYGIVNNDLSVVRHLIDSGADVNVKDQVRVLRHYAQIHQHLQMKVQWSTCSSVHDNS